MPSAAHRSHGLVVVQSCCLLRAKVDLTVGFFVCKATFNGRQEFLTHDSTNVSHCGIPGHPSHRSVQTVPPRQRKLSLPGNPAKPWATARAPVKQGTVLSYSDTRKALSAAPVWWRDARPHLLEHSCDWQNANSELFILPLQYGRWKTETRFCTRRTTMDLAFL